MIGYQAAFGPHVNHSLLWITLVYRPPAVICCLIVTLAFRLSLSDKACAQVALTLVSFAPNLHKW